VHTRALIIGTGFSGLGMPSSCSGGASSSWILEKAAEIGGTWRDNTYPGCACDIPSHMYSFSFEPKPDWQHMWSFQPEIFDYLKGVTDKYGLRRYIQFNSHVDRAHWDDDELRWHVFTKDGHEFVAQFVVSGVGGLHIPLIPSSTGSTSTGMLEAPHSIRAVGPQRRPVREAGGGHRHGCQRDPDRPGDRQRRGAAAAVSADPGLGDAPAQQSHPGVDARHVHQRPWHARVDALGHLLDSRGRGLCDDAAAAAEKSVSCWANRTSGVQSRTGSCAASSSRTTGRLQAHPQLRHLLPGHRQSQDGGHHRRHCPVHPRGIVTADGTEREADVVVFATGFHVTDSYTYVDIKGPGGEDLVDRWTREGVSALRGITIADMPNLFFLLGPNTALGHNSVVS